MKLLSQSQLLAYLPATEAETAQAIADFDAIAPTLFHKPGSLKRMVSEGFVEPLTVTVDGEAVLVLFVSFSPDSGLWIHAAQAIKTTSLQVTFTAAEFIQRDKRLSYTRFMTVRRGMVETALQRGFKIDGLILSKE